MDAGEDGAGDEGAVLLRCACHSLKTGLPKRHFRAFVERKLFNIRL